MSCYELWSIWGQWVSGIGTVIVSIVLGIVTFKISRKQVVLTEQSLKLGLYNQRYEVYRRLENIIQNIISKDEKTRTEAIYNLMIVRDDVDFLFDEDVHKYVLEIINKNEELSKYQYGNEPDDVYFNLIGWFKNQYADEKRLRAIFRMYLDLSDYGILKS